MSNATRAWALGLARVVISSAAASFVASQAAQSAVPSMRTEDMLKIAAKVLLLSGLTHAMSFLARSPLPDEGAAK